VAEQLGPAIMLLPATPSPRVHAADP